MALTLQGFLRHFHAHGMLEGADRIGVIEKRDGTSWWKVLDPAGELVCLTVFRRGAREVAGRLNAAEKDR